MNRVARNRRVLILLGLLIALLTGATQAATVRVYRHEGMIHGVTVRIFASVEQQAAAAGDDLVLFELDTPGGLVDSTEQIVRDILASKVPVAVYVAPQGAHAASAGFFILLAADLAAMAPTTRTGASHPIRGEGENRPDDILLKKMAEDASALLRSTAQLRGRPAAVAEKAVTEAKSWTADEALTLKLIDLIATDRADLIKKLDGREFTRSDGSRATLRLADPKFVLHHLEWSRSIANVVLHPVVLAMLLSIGALALYVEFTHPGFVLPGVVGAICVLVFLYGSSVLPVNYFAAALIVLGVVMFILEIKVSSYGMLGLTGGVSVLSGLYLLFPRDIPGLEVPTGSLLTVGILLVIGLGLIARVVAKAQQHAVATGREGLIGAIGLARTAIDSEGTVFVHGELWKARSRVQLAAGQGIRVVAQHGLVLEVEAAARSETIESGSSPGPRRID